MTIRPKSSSNVCLSCRTMTHPLLDRPEVLQVMFYPRRELAATPNDPRTRSVCFEVEPAIHISGRLYPAEPESPAILCYHGNGEIAADYDDLAQLYTRLGITLLVVDYRGYGSSDGTPTATDLLADAVTVFEGLDRILGESRLSPSRLYLMGRSLGSAAAIEVTRHHSDQLAGLIIESGFAHTFDLLARMGVHIQGAEDARDGFGNAEKMQEITIPTLIIHGQRDALIPVADGQELYRRCAAPDKRLVLIPGAGHNDLMMFGVERYFTAIRSFVFGGTAG
jgi:alpha-beta hydrolase superfamily lysophospholipase